MFEDEYDELKAIEIKNFRRDLEKHRDTFHKIQNGEPVLFSAASDSGIKDKFFSFSILHSDVDRTINEISNFKDMLNGFLYSWRTLSKTITSLITFQRSVLRVSIDMGYREMDELIEIEEELRQIKNDTVVMMISETQISITDQIRNPEDRAAIIANANKMIDKLINIKKNNP